MNKLVRTITAASFAASCAFLSTNVLAQDGTTASIGYSHFDFGSGIDLGVAVGSLGWEFGLDDRFSITPEARFGTGVKSDRGVELDRLFGAAARFNYKPTQDIYLYATTSYVNYRLKSRFASADTWEFGIGVGVGFNFTDNVGIEVQYENVDSVDVVTGALRFRF
jgi:opacity protein-like surface antigen